MGRLVRRPILNGIVLAALQIPSVAHGQDAGADEVTLKNGGTIRGTVISSEPGTSVKVVEVGQREPRTIPWSEVADVERGKYGHAAAPPVQPGSAGAGYGAEPSAAPQAQLGEDGVVQVHITSPSQASLVVHGFVGSKGSVVEQSAPVCQSPCNRVVDGSGGKRFSVSGDFPESGFVSFAGMKGDVLVAVKPGSVGGRTAGWVTLVSGITSSAVGTGLFLAGAWTAMSGGIPREAVWIVAGVTTGVGAAFIVGGIVLLAMSGTKVDVRPGAASGSHPAARKPNYLLGEF